MASQINYLSVNLALLLLSNPELPLLRYCQRTKRNRDIYVFLSLLVAPQALKSVLPVAESLSKKEMRILSRIRALQSTNATISITLRRKNNKASFCQLLSCCGSGDEKDLWCISVTSFCLFCLVKHHGLKITFHRHVKEYLFHFSAISPAFFRYSGWQRPMCLPPVISSAISSTVFFDDSSWSSSDYWCCTAGQTRPVLIVILI